MFGSDILEVAIGVVFLFLFMSTIASALREAIEAIFKHRAVDLERGITEMLMKDDKESMVKEFYDHPLISSLFKGRYGEFAASLPAYIPKENFSLAILDLVAEASAASKVLSINDLKAKLQPVGGAQPNAVKRVVLNALSVADDDLGDLRKHIEGWYDGAMDRVTGWYARRTAAYLFLIGLGAAVALNVDAITVTKSLVVDRSLRQAVVMQAEKYLQGHAADAAAPDNGAKDGKTTAGQKQDFDKLRSEFAEIGFPIGWTYAGEHYYPTPQAACTGDGNARVCHLPEWPLVIMGWLITAIAVMLGAPFWFDLLNKLVSLRSALKPADDKPKKNKETVTAPALVVTPGTPPPP